MDHKDVKGVLEEEKEEWVNFINLQSSIYRAQEGRQRN